MGKVLITIKVMPTSPSVDMAKLRVAIEEKIVSLGGKMRETKEEPVAFGIKALICNFSWPEEKDPDAIETDLAKVKDVMSIQTIDVRRMIA